VLLLLSASACRELLPTNRYFQPRKAPSSATSTADARHRFDHSTHQKVLATAQLTCIDCHHFDVLIDTANEELAKALSAHALQPGSTPCHSCHTQPQTRLASAPQACMTCHQNLLPLMPDNHQVAWLKVHASVANTNPAQCDSCHRQSYCVDCHNRRDTIQTVVHERNFRFTHGVEARANPMRCGSCHRTDFCINCHQQGKVGIEP
jgi:nitrate/TMAO reductase-like tetraheme cytochrome c subunit